MSNMGYCRFENTLSDLIDCEKGLEDFLEYGAKLSDDELRAAKQLVKACVRILKQVSGVNSDFEIDWGTDGDLNKIHVGVVPLFDEMNKANS